MSSKDQFGRTLSKTRKKNGLSIAELARIAKVSASTIGRLESGKTKIPTTRVRDLLTATLKKPARRPVLRGAPIEREEIEILRRLREAVHLVRATGEGAIEDRFDLVLDLFNHKVAPIMNAERCLPKESLSKVKNALERVMCPECLGVFIYRETAENELADVDMRCPHCNVKLHRTNAGDSMRVTYNRWIAIRERKPALKTSRIPDRPTVQL